MRLQEFLEVRNWQGSSVFLRRLMARSVCDGLFLGLLAWYVVAGAALVPFHGDESTLLYMSRDYGHQFIDGEWTRVRFDQEWNYPDEQMLRMINGSIAKYSFGFAWHVTGHSLTDVNGPWDWGIGWDSNVSRGHMPPDRMLLAARIASSLYLAASVIALFVLAQTVGGRPAAYLACAYYALNPAVLLNGRRAMMEGSLLLFGLLVVLAGIYYLRRPRASTAVLMGLMAGLALAAKHTAAFPVVAVFGMCGLFPLLYPARGVDASQAIGYLAAAASAAAAAFLAFNPVWWGMNPVNFAMAILKERQGLLESYVAVYGGYTGPFEQVAAFFRQAFVVTPQYFEVPRFAPWVADQVAQYEASPWNGVRIGGSTAGAVATIGVVVLGAASFLQNVRISLETRWVVGTWMFVIVLSTWLLTPLEWQRYYLPVFPVVALLAGIGAAAILQLGKKTITESRRERHMIRQPATAPNARGSASTH